MLADDVGAVTDTYTYDAFGNLISSTGNTVNDFLYRGEQFDSFTGLYYLRARYMNPSTGTFITMDEYAGSIFEPVSLHKYLYANANPVMYSDPSGYSSLGEMIATTAIIGVLSGISNSVISIATFLGEGGQWGDIDWGSVLLNSLGSACVGAIFGVAGWYAQFIQSAIIMSTLGFSSLVMAAMSALQAEYYEDIGNDNLAKLYWALYWLGVIGGVSAFNQACTYQSAKATATTTTNNSSSNTSKAENSSQKQSSQSNVSKNQTLKENCQNHIFSEKHIKGGIMDLGESRNIIMDSALNTIRDISDNNLLPEGSLQIKTHINGYKAEIRTYVQNGELIKFDVFKGWSSRSFSNSIYW